MEKTIKPAVYIAADNITSPIGNTTKANFEQVKNGVSGLRTHNRPNVSAQPIVAALFDERPETITGGDLYTKFEQLLIHSIANAIGQTKIQPKNKKVGLIISTTKGNISLLETREDTPELRQRISLNTSASMVAGHFGFKNQPVIVSNACISGVMAVITGARFIETGVYDHVVVTGADVVSKFVSSGFLSFQALSNVPCKPFDKNRSGLNLGEGAATVILSSDKKYAGNIRVTSGGISNDANHISGPSRTGQELSDAIAKAINTAGISAAQIDAISAHGTATPYNDEMEANALTLAGVAQAPLMALKGSYGHTLGAAGLIETVLLAQSMRSDELLPSLGFTEAGTKPLNVNTFATTAVIRHGLKTASGFGGCNAALVLSK